MMVVVVVDVARVASVERAVKLRIANATGAE